MSLYTYTFLEENFKREQVTAHLDTWTPIKNWFYCLPNMVFIETNLSAKALSEGLSNKFGKHRHFISRVSSNDRWGVLPKDQWNLFPNDNG